MKKIIVAITALMLALSLAACGAATSKVEVSRGVWDGNVYSNAFTGFKFTKPDGWYTVTDEELANMFSQSADIFGVDPEDFAEAAEKQQFIYDAMVLDRQYGDNLMVMYENLGIVGQLALNEDDYINAMVEQLGLQNQLNYSYVDTVDGKLAGADCRIATITMSDSSASGTQYYFVRKAGSYIIIVIVTDMTGRPLEDYSAMFSPLD